MWPFGPLCGDSHIRVVGAPESWVRSYDTRYVLVCLKIYAFSDWEWAQEQGEASVCSGVSSAKLLIGFIMTQPGHSFPFHMPRFGLDGPLSNQMGITIRVQMHMDHTDSSKIGIDLWETDLLYGGFC